MLEAGVYLAPGAFYHAKEAGWFRLTFCVEEEIISIGFDRLARALKLDGLYNSSASMTTNAELDVMTASFTTADLASELALGMSLTFANNLF